MNGNWLDQEATLTLTLRCLFLALLVSRRIYQVKRIKEAQRIDKKRGNKYKTRILNKQP